MPGVWGSNPRALDPTVFDGVEDDAYAITDFNSDLLTSLFAPACSLSLDDRRTHDRLLRHRPGSDCLWRVP